MLQHLLISLEGSFSLERAVDKNATFYLYSLLGWNETLYRGDSMYIYETSQDFWRKLLTITFVEQASFKLHFVMITQLNIKCDFHGYIALAVTASKSSTARISLVDNTPTCLPFCTNQHGVFKLESLKELRNWNTTRLVLPLNTKGSSFQKWIPAPPNFKL